MNVTWIHIPTSASLMLDEQWQCRADGRSVAVFARAACPQHCDCVTHVYHGERHDRVECEAPFWRGVVVGADGLVQDVEITTGGLLPAAVQAEFERILGTVGWEVSSAEV